MSSSASLQGEEEDEEVAVESLSAPPPDFLFIIPVSADRAAIYRDLVRLWMNSTILPNKKAKLLFVEQVAAAGGGASGTFNAGAMKNAGYLYLRSCFPETKDWSGVTLVFQDLDKFALDAGAYLPATPGVVNSLYMIESSGVPVGSGLGGVFSICASDFERSGGFPNCWGWVPDEMEIARRLLLQGIKIDMSTRAAPNTRFAQLIPFSGSPLLKTSNAFELYRFSQGIDAAIDGWRTLGIQEWVEDPATQTLKVQTFTTPFKEAPQYRQTVNLAATPVPALMNRAMQWYRDAYTSAASTPGGELTWATQEGIERIKEHIRQHPRNRLQQLRFQSLTK